MKRDMELIRLLLLDTEGGESQIDFGIFTEQQRIYHAAILIEAGLIDGVIRKDENGLPSGAVRLRLTWAGHEFLDAARNETIWKKAGEKIKQTGVQVTVSVLEELLKKLLKDSLGLP
jgi:hypothetical protein